MAYRNQQQANAYMQQLIRDKQLEELKERQRRYGLGNYVNDGMDVYNRAKGVYNNVTGIGNRLNGYGNNLSSFGSKLSQSQNPRLANMGVKLQNVGNKFQTVGNRLNGGSLGTGTTAGSTGLNGTVLGTSGTSTLGSGTSLGNAIAGQTAGTAGTTGASSGALGSAIAGQTAGAGAGTAAGSGALAGSIGGATGGTAAATGASAGTIGAGTAAGAGGTAAAGGAAAGGATAAAGGAAAAIPVAGWVVAALAAAKMIKDKIDAAHKKVNMKAMQADATNMNKAITANQESANNAQQNLQQDAEADLQALNTPEQGYEGQLPDMSAYQSGDDMANGMINELQQPEQTGSPVDTQLGINTPEMLQNPLDESGNNSISGMIGKFLNNGGTATGGAAATTQDTSVKPVVIQDENFDANNQPLKNWDENTFNAINEAKSRGIDDGALLNSMTQGLNSGNKDIASIIDKYSIRKPQTEEEIASAKNGSFNMPQPSQSNNQPITVSNGNLKEDLMQRIANGIKNFQAGYKDNSNSTFTQGDLYKNAFGNQQNPSVQNGTLTGAAAQTKKTLMNRLGELAGTGQRVLANPLTQGLIAGTIAGIQDGDIGTGLQTAYDWAGRKAKSNDYYRKLHPNSNYIPVFGGDYDANDLKAQSAVDYQSGMLDINQKKQEDSHNKEFGKAGDVWAAYASTDPEYYKEIVNDSNFDPNAEISKTDVKNYIEARRKQNDSTERSRHNKTMEGISYGNLGLRREALNETKSQNAFNNKLKKEYYDSRNYSTELNTAKAVYEQKAKMLDSLDLDEDERIALQDELAKKYNQKIADINSKYTRTNTNTSTNTSTNTKPQKVNGGLAF